MTDGTLTFVNVTPDTIETVTREINPSGPQPVEPYQGRVIPVERTITVQGSLAEVVGSSFKRKKWRMEWYSKNRISFPLGYGCTIPPWSPKLFDSVLDEITKILAREKPTTLEWLAQCTAPVWNMHLLFDTKTNRIGCRDRREKDGHWYTSVVWEDKKKFLDTFHGFFNFTYKFEGQKFPREYSLLEIYCTSTYVQAVSGKLFVPYHDFDTDLPRYLPSDTLNLFSGLRYDYNEALSCWRTSPEGRRQVALFLLHQCYVLCNAWRDRTDYALIWMAKKVKQPHWKPNTAIVIHGKEGAGKTR